MRRTHNRCSPATPTPSTARRPRSPNAGTGPPTPSRPAPGSTASPPRPTGRPPSRRTSARLPADQPARATGSPPRPARSGSPWTLRYPHPGADGPVAAAAAALPAWRDAGPQTRAQVCLEILPRLHRPSFELANAVHATTGQAFVMAFQAGGAHALDRALEALAYAYPEMPGTPPPRPGRRRPARATRCG